MPPNENIFKEGVNLFKQQRYEESITIFKNLVKEYQLEDQPGDTQRKNFVNLLDCLSASYSKVQKLDRSIKCAEKMIDVDPFGCKGYLRLAKVYRLQDRENNAYEILKHGYLKIKEEKMKPQYTLFNETLYKQLKEELKLAKKRKGFRERSYDPLKDFPDEIIGIIFSEFSPYFNLQCLIVSKLWYKRLVCVPYIFNNCHLKKNIRKQEFDRFLGFVSLVSPGSHNFVKSINIQPHKTVEQTIINDIFKREIKVENLSIELESLNLFSLTRSMKNSKLELSSIKSLSIDLPIITNENTSIEAVLSKCPNVSKFVIKIPKYDSRSHDTLNTPITFPSLTSLTIVVERSMQKHQLNNVIINNFLLRNNFPSLEHLSFSKVNLCFEVFQKIITTKLKTIELELVPNICIIRLTNLLISQVGNKVEGRLEELRIVENDVTMEVPSPNWELELTKFQVYKNLKTLVLRHSHVTPKLLLAILISTSCELEELHLILNSNIIFGSNRPSTSNRPLYGSVDIIELIEKIPRIKQLSLVGCFGMDNTAIIRMAKHIAIGNLFGHLSYLNLSLNKIDGRGILQLLGKTPKLKLETLVINFTKVDANTVRYLRELRVCKKIEYKMDDRVSLL